MAAQKSRAAGTEGVREKTGWNVGVSEFRQEARLDRSLSDRAKNLHRLTKRICQARIEAY